MALSSSMDHQAIEKLVAQVAALARSDEACKLLGVEGVLEGQLDLAFLNDPVEWLADDIANAIIASQDGDDDEDEDSGDNLEGESLTLDIIVAEYRLCQLVAGSMDDSNLVRRVRESIEQRQG